MDEESQGSLLKEINSKDFDISQCINYLKIHSDSIGIHHFLVQKLFTYNYDEIEFYIPQLVQLSVAYETNSMALEDFLVELSNSYPHFCLIVFWNLQAYIFELRNDPESYSFQTVRKFINKIQNIMFNASMTQREKDHEFRENLHPALVSVGAIAAAFALPSSAKYALPLIKSQSRQQRSFVFQLANFQKALTKNLTLKNQRVASSDLPRAVKSPVRSSNSPRLSSTFSISSERNSYSMSREEYLTFSSDEERISMDSATNTQISKTQVRNDTSKTIYNAGELLNSGEPSTLSKSLPDLRDITDSIGPYISPTESESSLNFPHASILHHKESTPRGPNPVTSLLSQQRILFTNYAKKETDFIMSLQNISFRLSQIPKEARLSSLRAELSMLNEYLLPSEIDIPQLLPLTSHKNKKYHKILKLNVNEAFVLNSAERVPFLLLIEYLSDEFDFNPQEKRNQEIIANAGKNEAPKRPDAVAPPLSDMKPLSKEKNVVETEIPGSFIGEDEADLGDIDTMQSDHATMDLNKLKLLEHDEPQESLKTQNRHPIGPELPSKLLASQMRIASVMLQQLEDSGKQNTEQSASIRSRIVDSMISLQDQFDSINYEKLNQLKGDDVDAGERKLENDSKLGEDWNTKKNKIKKSSVYGHLYNWDLCSVIAKNGDDLPQEAFACQLISIISNIWKQNKVPYWTKRMKILITSANSGLVETINNAMSIHSIKKSLTELSIADGENTKGRIFTLSDYFSQVFGSPSGAKYKKAQENFARSLASYSILCYVLQIKDRHNGNIMLDNEGHIVHIDFGFILSNSPGSLGFEAAPFKLTMEYVDLLGGLESQYYLLFKDVCKKCFRTLRKESSQIVNIVELMQKDSSLPCFNNGENTSVLLSQRLQPHLSDDQCDAFVETALIQKSIGNMYTRLYDQFQMITQGIYN